MENLFKQAQNAGISVEKQAARAEIGLGSISAPDMRYYEKGKDRIDYSGAVKGLEKLVENEAEYQRETDFVEGQLAAQTGEAIDENASKWTKRGYSTFKLSAEVNKLNSGIISKMDEYAEKSPEEFQQLLKESYEELASKVEDPFLKKQLSKMFTHSSSGLIKQHTVSREQINQQKTINYARENVVSSLRANGGVVNKEVLRTIEQTKAALPDVVAYGVIADSAYTAMLSNGDTGLYEHLDKEGYFSKLDANTRNQLTSMYKRVTKAKEEAAKEAIAEINAVNFVEQGGLNDERLSTSDKEKMFKTWINSRKGQYPITAEGKEQQMADIMEMSVRNNFYSHEAAKNIKNYITQPTTFVEGKPAFRTESASAYAAIYTLKERLGANAEYALRTFLDEETLATIDQVNEETDNGILSASPDELRAAIMRVNAANNAPAEKQKAYQDYVASDEYKEAEKFINDKIQDKFGDGLFGRAYTSLRVANDYLSPVAAFSRKVLGNITDTAELRGVKAKNPEVVTDAFQRALKTEMISTKDPKIAAKRAAYTVANRTHNILGNYMIYDPLKVDNSIVSFPQYFGLNPGDSDDDVSEAIGTVLLDCTEGDVHKSLRKNLLDAEITLDTDNDTLRIVYDYDARSLSQKLFSRSWNPFATDDEIQDAESAENASFDVTIPVSSIREYFIEKRRVDSLNENLSTDDLLSGKRKFGEEDVFSPKKGLINEQDL
jgi:hypothetical protein|nr:MAG TPA: Tail associated lysozyme [Caudoviricetes sp.]